MNYPLISEYVEAIKSAEDNFEELSYLRPVLGDDGLPVMTSGNFAVVFKMKDEQSGKFYAVKCFTKEQEGRAEAYREIAKELKDVSSPYLVSIRYLEKELFVDTDQTTETEFPVLLMEWVEGKTLDKYLRENLDDKYALEMLAYSFSQLAQWLIPQPFAHGDLKPDNILVREDGTLVLVDYDGMYVPAMKGQKARELGSPDYRHPQRTENDFDEHIDDFPLVTMLLSLKCILFNPQLYEDKSSNDAIFLCESDYRDWANSNINRSILELINCKDIARLYALFILVLTEKRMDYNTSFFILKDVKETPFFNSFKTKAQWDNDSKFCLSCCLRNGFGCKKNVKQSVELILQLSIQGDAKAQTKLAGFYYCGDGCKQNYEKAVEWNVKAAEQGNATAQNNLGVCYKKGHGVAQNFEVAIEWYTKAAEQGNATAQNNLGNCFFYGEGCKQSYEKAIEWYTKAAEQGNAIALNNLGSCYENGYGVIQSLEKAIEFYTKAAELGNEDSIESLYHIARNYCEQATDKKKKDYDKAFKLFVKTANLGHAEAQCCVGCCYKHAYGTCINFGEAIIWFEKSSMNGCARAFRHIAMCYEEGVGVEKDINKALKWYNKAICSDDYYSMVAIGMIFYYGKGGIAINYEEAVKWYKKASEMGESNGMWRLGMCYEFGNGVPLDWNKARELYEKASSLGNKKAQNALASTELPF